MNIVTQPKVFRARRDRSRVDRRTFFKDISRLTGPGFSATAEPKGWTKARYQRLLDRVGPAIFTRGVAQKHVRDWTENKNNLKVTASLDTPTRQTLVYLDVDTRPGTTADAVRLLELARPKLPFASVYRTDRGVGAWVRVSTNEATGRGYYRSAGAERYNALLDRIQVYLRSLAAAHHLDVSSVEVHGRVTVVGNDGQVRRCADLWKCPPGEESRGRRAREWHSSPRTRQRVGSAAGGSGIARASSWPCH